MGPDAVTIQKENRVRLARALAKHEVELTTLTVLGTQPVDDPGRVEAGQVVTYQGVRAITGTPFHQGDTIPRDTFVRFIANPQRVARVELFVGGRQNNLVESVALPPCDCGCIIIDAHPLSDQPTRQCPVQQGIVHVYEPPGPRLQRLYALSATEVAPTLEVDVPTIRAFAGPRPDTCRPEPGIP